MENSYFGFVSKQTFNLVILFTILIILGIVTFYMYAYISLKKKINMGFGAGMNINLPFLKKKKRNM